jgi:hypothetical protein
MGGSERLYDVFQAMANTSNMIVGIAGQMKKEAADAKLRSDELDLLYASEQFIAGLAGRNDYANFEKDWQKQKTGLYSAAMKSAQNNYTRRALERMYASHDVRQKLAIEAATAKSAADHANVLDTTNINRITTMPLPGQQRIDMTQDIRRKQYESGRIDHNTYHIQSLQDVTNTMYSDGLKLIEDELAATGNEERDPLARIQKKIAEMPLDGYALRLVDPNTGAETDRSVDIPREGIREQLLQAAGERWNGYVKGVQNQSASTLSDIRLAIGSAENPADQADLARQGLALMRGGEMAGWRLGEEDRLKYTHEFERFLKEFADDPGRAWRNMFKDTLKNNMEWFVDQTIAGAFPSLADAREMFIDWAHKEAREKHQYAGSVADMEREFYDVFGEFFKSSLDRVSKQSPEYAASIKLIEDYVKQEYKDNGPLAKKFPYQQDRNISEAVEYAYDLIVNSDFAKVTPEYLVKRTRDFLAAKRSEKLDILRVNPETGEPNFKMTGLEFNEEAIAKGLLAAQDPDAIWTDTYGRTRYATGTAEGLEELDKALRTRLAEVLDVDVHDIRQGDGVVDAGRDKNVPLNYFAGGKEYLFRTDDGKTYRIEELAEDGEAKLIAGTRGEEIREERATNRAAESRRQAANEEAATAHRSAAEDLAARSVDSTIYPKGMDALGWQLMHWDEKSSYLLGLMEDDPEAFEDYKRRLEQERRR